MLEIRCAILNHLKSDEVVEGGTAVLRVALSKSRPEVIWGRNGEPIAIGGRFKVEIENGGLLHTLTIESFSTDDSGDFTANIDDGINGVLASTCKIIVKGKHYTCV